MIKQLEYLPEEVTNLYKDKINEIIEVLNSAVPEYVWDSIEKRKGLIEGLCDDRDKNYISKKELKEWIELNHIYIDLDDISGEYIDIDEIIKHFNL